MPRLLVRLGAGNSSSLGIWRNSGFLLGGLKIYLFELSQGRLQPEATSARVVQ